MLDKKVISKEQGQALAEELQVSFMETSAKSNIGVEEAFFSLARDIKKRLIDTAQDTTPAKPKAGVNIGEQKVPASSTGCCQ